MQVFRSVARQSWRSEAGVASQQSQKGQASSVSLSFASPAALASPELLAVQIADEISDGVARARMQMMADFGMVGVILIAADASGAPLTCEMAHHDLMADDGPQRLLAMVERLELLAPARVGSRAGG